MASMIVEIKVMSYVAKVAEVKLSYVSPECAFQTSISVMVRWTALQEKMRVVVKKPGGLRFIKALHGQIEEMKLKK